MKQFLKTLTAFLKIKHREDRGVLWFFCQIIIVMLAFTINANNTIGLALLIGGMLLNTYFTAVFHERKGIDIILIGERSYIKIRYNLILVSVMIENLPMSICLLIYFYLSTNQFSAIIFIYAFIVSVYVNALGILISYFCKNQKIALIICSLFIFSNFLKVLFLEEYFRFFSPVVQIANLNRFQWWNLLMLLAISMTVLIFIYFKRKRVILLGVLLMASIILIDVFSSHQQQVLPANYKNFVETILYRINEKNKKCGFPDYKEIEVYKSTYYPWKPDRDKVIVSANQSTLFMNCFTESLCNMNEKEVIARTIYSLLEPESIQQQAIADLYIETLSGNTNYVEQFLHENQINKYGEVLSKNYGLYAEVLINQSQDFAKLYQLARDYTTTEELLGAWDGEIN